MSWQDDEVVGTWQDDETVPAPGAPRDRSIVPDTPSMRAAEREQRRGERIHPSVPITGRDIDSGLSYFGDVGRAAVGFGRRAASAVGSAGDAAAYAARTVTTPHRMALEALTGADVSEDAGTELSRAWNENPGVKMARDYVGGISDRGTRALEAGNRGDTQEAVYQSVQALLSGIPGYAGVSRLGEAATGNADGQSSVLEADPGAAGELGFDVAASAPGVNAAASAKLARVADYLKRYGIDVLAKEFGAGGKQNLRAKRAAQAILESDPAFGIASSEQALADKAQLRADQLGGVLDEKYAAADAAGVGGSTRPIQQALEAESDLARRKAMGGPEAEPFAGEADRLAAEAGTTADIFESYNADVPLSDLRAKAQSLERFVPESGWNPQAGNISPVGDARQAAATGYREAVSTAAPDIAHLNRLESGLISARDWLQARPLSPAQSVWVKRWILDAIQSVPVRGTQAYLTTQASRLIRAGDMLGAVDLAMNSLRVGAAGSSLENGASDGQAELDVPSRVEQIRRMRTRQ